MKSEISSLRAEVNQRHENNLQKIHYLEDLLGTYVPGIVSLKFILFTIYFELYNNINNEIRLLLYINTTEVCLY